MKPQRIIFYPDRKDDGYTLYNQKDIENFRKYSNLGYYYLTQNRTLHKLSWLYIENEDYNWEPSEFIITDNPNCFDFIGDTPLPGRKIRVIDPERDEIYSFRKEAVLVEPEVSGEKGVVKRWRAKFPRIEYAGYFHHDLELGVSLDNFEVID